MFCSVAVDQRMTDTRIRWTYGGVFTRVSCLPKSSTKKTNAPPVMDAVAVVSRNLRRKVRIVSV